MADRSLRHRVPAPLRSVARRAVLDPVRGLARGSAARAIDRSLAISAKAIPIQPDTDTLVLGLPRAVGADGDTDPPLPSGELWGVDADYLESGAFHVGELRRQLADVGVSLDDLGPILDFGCGTGRMTRHLSDHAREHDVWGVDVNAAGIAWAQQHLAPPLRFAACTSFPHLPFEDGAFDLVYAASVFTHISELADAWLLELRRITRPGGHLWLTVQDQRFVDGIRATPPEQHNWLNTFLDDNAELVARLGRDASMVAVNRLGGDPMVLHDRASLVAAWGQHLEVVAVVDQAFYEQSALICRKHTR